MSAPLVNDPFNSSRKAYVSTDTFDTHFLQYVTRVVYGVTEGTVSQLPGATPLTCPKGRILRENGRKKYPGANPGVTAYLVGVYDVESRLTGYIDPTQHVFAPFSTDANYLFINPDNTGSVRDQSTTYGPSVYTNGNIQTTTGIVIAQGLQLGTPPNQITYTNGQLFLNDVPFLADISGSHLLYDSGKIDDLSGNTLTYNTAVFHGKVKVRKLSIGSGSDSHVSISRGKVKVGRRISVGSGGSRVSISRGKITATKRLSVGSGRSHVSIEHGRIKGRRLSIGSGSSHVSIEHGRINMTKGGVQVAVIVDDISGTQLQYTNGTIDDLSGTTLQYTNGTIDDLSGNSLQYHSVKARRLSVGSGHSRVSIEHGKIKGRRLSVGSGHSHVSIEHGKIRAKKLSVRSASIHSAHIDDLSGTQLQYHSVKARRLSVGSGDSHVSIEHGKIRARKLSVRSASIHSARIYELSGNSLQYTSGTFGTGAQAIEFNNGIITIGGTPFDVSGTSLTDISGNNLNYFTGSINDLSGISLVYDLGDVSALTGDNLNYNTGSINDLSGTYLTYTTGNVIDISGNTITYSTGNVIDISGLTLLYSTGDITDLNGDTVTYNTGTIYDLSGETLYYDSIKGRRLSLGSGHSRVSIEHGKIKARRLSVGSGYHSGISMHSGKMRVGRRLSVGSKISLEHGKIKARRLSIGSGWRSGASIQSGKMRLGKALSVGSKFSLKSGKMRLGRRLSIGSGYSHISIEHGKIKARRLSIGSGRRSGVSIQSGKMRLGRRLSIGSRHSHVSIEHGKIKARRLSIGSGRRSGASIQSGKMRLGRRLSVGSGVSIESGKIRLRRRLSIASGYSKISLEHGKVGARRLSVGSANTHLSVSNGLLSLNKSCGVADLSGGNIDGNNNKYVNGITVPYGTTMIFLTYQGILINPGFLSYTLDGTTLTIISSSSADQSRVNWFAIKNYPPNGPTSIYISNLSAQQSDLTVTSLTLNWSGSYDKYGDPLTYTVQIYSSESSNMDSAAPITQLPDAVTSVSPGQTFTITAQSGLYYSAIITTRSQNGSVKSTFNSLDSVWLPYPVSPITYELFTPTQVTNLQWDTEPAHKGGTTYNLIVLEDSSDSISYQSYAKQQYFRVDQGNCYTIDEIGNNYYAFIITTIYDVARIDSEPSSYVQAQPSIAPTDLSFNIISDISGNVTWSEIDGTTSDTITIYTEPTLPVTLASPIAYTITNASSGIQTLDPPLVPGNYYMATVTAIANGISVESTMKGTQVHYDESFQGPWSAATDLSGNVYVASYFNHAVYKRTPNVNEWVRICGTESSGNNGASGSPLYFQLSYPTGVAVDVSGAVYISDSINNRIIKVFGGGAYTMAGDPNGSAGYTDDIGSDARFNSPQHLCVDLSGTVYVADKFNSVIRKILADGTVTTVAGNSGYGYSGDGGVATDANFSYPLSVAVDLSGNLYIADTNNHVIRKVDTTGIITTIAGSTQAYYGYQDGVGGTVQFYSPTDITIDRNGGIYIADSNNNAIRFMTPAGVVTTLIAGFCQPESLSSPNGIAVDLSGNVFIANTNANVVNKFTRTDVVHYALADAPTNVLGTPGDQYVDVTWTAPNDEGSAITSYTVISNPGGFSATVYGSPPLTEARVGALANGTPYTFTVYAVNSVGNGLASAPSPSYTPIAVPGAPTNVTATPGNASASVSWTAPLNDGGGVTSYIVYPDPLDSPPVYGFGNPPNTTFPVSGLTNGTSYTFTVKAHNAAGDSASSEPSSSIVPFTVPDAPTITMVTSGNEQVIISWDEPNDRGSGITSYTVTSDPGSYTATVTGTPPIRTAAVTGLTNGTSYTFTVVAHNAGGDGSPSSASSSAIPYTVPDAPTAVHGISGDGQATISWTAPTNNGYDTITSYTVRSSPGNYTTTVSGTTGTVSGLTNGTDYTFTVTAHNTAGDSSASTASSTITPLAYAIPDFNYTINDLSGNTDDNIGPLTYTAIASGLPNPNMNGTYITTGRHFFNGDGLLTTYATIRCFERILPTDASGGWLSRTASNNYAADGSYIGATTTIVDGVLSIKGEYITITAPYSFVLKSYTLVTGHRGVPIGSWLIAGSNDGGSTWTAIDLQEAITITNYKIKISLSSNTISYNSYILIVTSNSASGSQNGANIDTWNLCYQ